MHWRLNTEKLSYWLCDIPKRLNGVVHPCPCLSAHYTKSNLFAGKILNLLWWGEEVVLPFDLWVFVFETESPYLV